MYVWWCFSGQVAHVLIIPIRGLLCMNDELASRVLLIRQEIPLVAISASEQGALPGTTPAALIIDTMQCLSRPLAPCSRRSKSCRAAGCRGAYLHCDVAVRSRSKVASGHVLRPILPPAPLREGSHPLTTPTFHTLDSVRQAKEKSSHFDARGQSDSVAGAVADPRRPAIDRSSAHLGAE